MNFATSIRYPDPAFQIIDPSFARYRLFSSHLEQLGTGMRWAEGPVWFGDGKYVLVSDVPNNRIMKWDEASGAFGPWRAPSDFANGNARDQLGRLITCEHGTRRVTRTEIDGAITVLADRFDGKRLNSPNDIVCQRNGTIWFTDPSFGIDSNWEGFKSPHERPHAVYRHDPDGALHCVLTDIAAPNGLAFSPDEKTLYLVESRAQPHRLIWAYDVGHDGSLSNRRKFLDAGAHGAYDGFRVDVDGNLWCGFGSNGHADADLDALDGVVVYNPEGKLIGRIKLPERCANLCFGGAHKNRLFMAASHSLYAIYVNTQGAV